MIRAQCSYCLSNSFSQTHYCSHFKETPQNTGHTNHAQLFRKCLCSGRADKPPKSSPKGHTWFFLHMNTEIPPFRNPKSSVKRRALLFSTGTVELLHLNFQRSRQKFLPGPHKKEFLNILKGEKRVKMMPAFSGSEPSSPISAQGRPERRILQGRSPHTTLREGRAA